MFNVVKKEIEWAGKKLSIETGKIARQADGAVILRAGDTVILATAVAAKKSNPETDFFPLTVNYQEKYYAAGKIPGGYFKREARPTEAETLTSRLIDRPIRPLFPNSFRNETQVLATVISYDKDNDPEILSLIASSAALSISGLPFMGPVAASKVGYVNNEFILNPTKEMLQNSSLELVVAGTKDAVLMVESETSGLTEEQMLAAVKFGHKGFSPVIKMIEELKKEVSKEEIIIEEKDFTDLKKKVSDLTTKKLEEAFSEKDKKIRGSLINEAREIIQSSFEGDETYTKVEIMDQFKNLEKDIVRTKILKNKVRIDGRKLNQVRPIQCEVGILPRVHGSSLFTRGETQAIVATTLATADDEQRTESLEGMQRSRFMLHYNFPPFSVGEVGRIGTGRREIGHGKLAWRAVNAALPKQEDFPYTIRVVSEITESNGSSSMATVCGTSLALMDAGVPLAKPVAGIAMGLIKEGGEYAVLSDILGDEDHLGDMDFKVAGTDAGITALQMDIKITSITPEIMQIALDQARDGRIHILGEMAKALTAARDGLAESAPKITTLKIPVDKIREVIGPGGKMIREIVEETGAKIDIEDDGSVSVAAVSQTSSDAALARIREIVAEPELGEIYTGKVVKTVDFGAFVNFLGARDGLVHISEMKNERVAQTTDVCKEGDMVKVKVIGFDDRGKVKLSMKRVDQETGDDLETGEKAAD